MTHLTASQGRRSKWRGSRIGRFGFWVGFRFRGR
ncbi:hypothetical protein GobsT_12580 [Gemmata obscuriglobus]|nr:hypothetical protein GobsT_12580 [Gemmata obscuriglobus]VTS01842.1 unnamed protein product [Gemmata obscuriglobus UQM 2246]